MSNSPCDRRRWTAACSRCRASGARGVGRYRRRWRRYRRCRVFAHCACAGKKERCYRFKRQQHLGIIVVNEGHPLTLSVVLATNGPVAEPQCSRVASELILYLLGGRSSERDAHTGPVLRAPTHWWVASTSPSRQPRATLSMYDHAGERRLPGFIVTAKFLQCVVKRKQVLHPQAVRAQTDDETQFYVR